MDDANQIEPPASFAAIYTSADGSRLTRPAGEIIARYELCEDIAQTMSERAATLLATSNDSERQVLVRVREALNGDNRSVTSAESTWVVRRLAELLDWPS